jgi:predicted ribosome-associated RNA-binding protein Tma20
MDVEVINSLINNSTWSTLDNAAVYKFANGKDVYINGNTHYDYTINRNNNRIVMILGAAKKYYVNFINDFTLEFYNAKEKFRIRPESNL